MTEKNEITSCNPAVRQKVIILFYHNMSCYGGIQTLIIRLAQAEVMRGNRVILAIGCDKAIPEANSFEIFDINNFLPLLEELKSERSVDILAFAPHSAAVAYQFCSMFSKKGIHSRVALGVYHPRDFFRENEKKHLHYINFFLARILGSNKIFFMNEDCKISHAQSVWKGFSNSLVLPVPMDSRSAIWQPTTETSILKIVCVGRIVPFKAYNFTIPKIIKDLRSLGQNAYCDIFGHGSHEAELVNLIKDNDASGFVRFHGAIELSKFDVVTSTYDLFIGMGTAALQAAQLGIPTILAIDEDGDNCYGYISDVPFGNVGENSNSIPRISMAEAILNFSKLTADERKDVSNRCRKAALLYESDNYVETALDGRDFRTGFKSWFGLMSMHLYRFIGEKNMVTSYIFGLFRRNFN